MEPLFVRQPLSYLPTGDAALGAEPTRDMGVRLRVQAPKAARVTLDFHIAYGSDVTLKMRENGDGLFECVIPYAPEYAGYLPVHLCADGAELLSPYLPVGWCGNRPVNFVEVPSPLMDFCSPRDVPHGALTALTYPSSVMDNELRCMVYTPPGALRNGESYPVLYLLHGGTENELAWSSAYKLPDVLDNLFFDGKAAPFVVVMVNAMVRFADHERYTWDDAPERMLLNDCIPFVERTLNVKHGRENRALAGLSMGAYLTNDIGLAHPELFSAMGQFTGCMYHATDTASYERPYAAAMARYAKEPQSFPYRLFFRSTTPREDHFDYFEQDDAICAHAGIDRLPSYQRIVYPANTSKCYSWRMGLRDFAQRLFQA